MSCITSPAGPLRGRAVLPTSCRRTTCNASAKSPLARDVRAIPIKLISVGKGNSTGAVMMTSEWIEKLKRYTQVTEVTIKQNPKRAQSPQLQMAAEADKVLKAIDPRDHVVLLDERGQDMTSEGLAKMIGRAGDEGTPLAFCIGGPFGHGPQVRERANSSIRLSSMVLNHQVALVVLVEQLYRGWTILRGEPYHH